ncbi:phage major capsid protein [Streptomyces sp. P3]|uniref:phage major capsid protein n=1 Tax=Streptomyces sp. P3 TaxID=2135430 RepID=UPI0020B15870|nr:phage major capsid protein [Streptomyces sp. P3]
MSTIKTITTDTWNGVSSAGVTAAWLAEADEVTDGSPTFAQPSIKPEKASAWVQGSFEVLADSGFGAEVGPLLADAKDRLEATAFATGDGSGKPKGVVPAVAAVSGSVVASATTDTYAVADVYAVEQSLPPRHRITGKPSWMAAKPIINKTRQFDTAGGSSFWANLGMGQPEQLLGAPIYEASAMDGTINAGAENYTLLLGGLPQLLHRRPGRDDHGLRAARQGRERPADRRGGLVRLLACGRRRRQRRRLPAPERHLIPPTPGARPAHSGRAPPRSRSTRVPSEGNVLGAGQPARRQGRSGRRARRRHQGP